MAGNTMDSFSFPLAGNLPPSTSPSLTPVKTAASPEQRAERERNSSCSSPPRKKRGALAVSEQPLIRHTIPAGRGGDPEEEAVAGGRTHARTTTGNGHTGPGGGSRCLIAGC
eukprot:gene5403-21464_t